jgi:hypothetical protein
MPYIPQKQREVINRSIDELVQQICNVNPAPGGPPYPDGVLNYIFTRLLQKTISPRSYLDFERAIGLLECCKLELYRRAAAPYENLKAKQNGDVYPAISGGQLDLGTEAKK